MLTMLSLIHVSRHADYFTLFRLLLYDADISCWRAAPLILADALLPPPMRRHMAPPLFADDAYAAIIFPFMITC